MIMETQQPNSGGDDAKRLAHEVDALIASREAELRELRERRADVERAFRVKATEDAEARARAAVEERRALDAELTEAAEEMFAAVALSQHHYQAAVEATNTAIRANGRVRHIAQRIAPEAKVPIGLALPDFVYRFGGRISAMLRQVKIPGQLGTVRMGPLELPQGGEFLPPKGDMASGYDWREREERAQASAINELLAHGR
jgi:hypothetical protein